MAADVGVRVGVPGVVSGVEEPFGVTLVAVALAVTEDVGRVVSVALGVPVSRVAVATGRPLVGVAVGRPPGVAVGGPPGVTVGTGVGVTFGAGVGSTPATWIGVGVGSGL